MVGRGGRVVGWVGRGRVGGVLCLRGLMFSYTERYEVGVLVRGVYTETESLRGMLYDNMEVLIERHFLVSLLRMERIPSLPVFPTLSYPNS